MNIPENNDLQQSIIFEEKPKMAICYDCDRTLSPDDMQTFPLIPSFGIDAGDFWRGSDSLAVEHLMDKNLAWMHELIKYSKFKGKSIRREYFKETGKNVATFEGDNTTSEFEYILGVVPSFIRLAIYAFTNWLPKFLIMLPDMLDVVINEGTF